MGSDPEEEGEEMEQEEEETYEEEKMNVTDCIKMAKEAFVENIPFEALKEDDIPKRYQYIFGFAAYVTLGVLFLYSLVTGYIDALEEKFMSLDSDSGNCTTVPVALTNSFVMDKIGNWEGICSKSVLCAIISVDLSIHSRSPSSVHICIHTYVYLPICV